MRSAEIQRFEAVVLPHVDALFQTALRLTETRGDAGEAVREACDSALKCWRRGVDGTDWRMLLFKILLQSVRRRARNAIDAGFDPFQETPEAFDDSKALSCSANQIVSAFDSLPFSLRAIITLVDCHEFSYSEAAGILGLTVEAVADGVMLGRKRLRLQLAEAPSGVSANR